MQQSTVMNLIPLNNTQGALMMYISAHYSSMFIMKHSMT